MAETKATADLAFDAFVESYALKYERAADCLSRIETRCSLFTTFQPSIKKPCGRPTRSKAPSPPCATARSDQRALYPTRRRSRLSSNWSRERRKVGAVSMATTSCQNSFSV
jgi:hypothetical protein